MRLFIQSSTHHSKNLSGLSTAALGAEAANADFRSLAVSCENFRRDPDSATSGSSLISSETDPASDRSLAIMNLAESDTERFVELVSFLSPVVQDVLFQYYLLGRTYAQIGAVLFPNKTTVAAQVLVKTANKLGVRALGGVIKCGGAPSREQAAKYPEAAEAYDDMHAFSVRLPDVPTVNLKTPRSFGQFAVTPNGDLSELFPPSWSVLRCRGIGKRNPETP